MASAAGKAGESNEDFAEFGTSLVRDEPGPTLVEVDDQRGDFWPCVVGVLGGDAKVTSCDWNDVLSLVSGRASTISVEPIPKSRSRLCWSAACFLTAFLVHIAMNTKKAIRNSPDIPQSANHAINRFSVGSFRSSEGRCLRPFVNPMRVMSERGMETTVTTMPRIRKRQKRRGRRPMGSGFSLAT